MSPPSGRVQGPAVLPVGRAWGARAEAEPVAGEGGACGRRHELPRHVPALVPGRVGQSACVCARLTDLRACSSLTCRAPRAVRRKSRGLGQGEAHTCPGFRGAPGLGPPFLGVSQAAPAQYAGPSGAPRWPRLPLLRAGRHRHRQRPLQGLHHTGGAPGGRLQPGPAWHHQPVRHRWGRQPHGRQHLPQRVGQPAGGAGERRWVGGGAAGAGNRQDQRLLAGGGGLARDQADPRWLQEPRARVWPVVRPVGTQRQGPPGSAVLLVLDGSSQADSPVL